MVIDSSGEWWTGDAPSDLDDYVVAYSAEEHPATTVVHAACPSCGGAEFGAQLDDEEGCAALTCAGCGADKALLDSADHLSDASLEAAECPCGGSRFNAAVGFAFYEGSEDVRWVYVVLRCVNDGVLGCYADWKIDYSPTHHLLGAV